MKLASLALFVLVAACGASSAPSAGTPSPVPAITPMAVTAVDFSCRLSVFVDSGQGSPGGAFIDFPSGLVTPDPAAAQVPSIVSRGREVVGNFYVHYYDRAYSRWLPVTRSSVSPDGAHYVYTDRAQADPQNPPTRATLHVIDVKTGIDTTFDDGAWSAPYTVLDYAAEGIYLTTTYGETDGIWLMDPATGVVTQIASVLNVQGNAGGNVFWVGSVNGRDPHPVAGVAADQLERLSLVDGSRVAWFYRPGTAVHFVNQDANGHPIIIVSGVNGPDELLLLPGPGVNRSILKFGNSLPSLASPISDSHGTWFGSTDGIYLYSEANGLRKVSDQPGYPANGCL